MKAVRIVLFDDLMNYLDIARSVDGDGAFADILTIAHEYAGQINAGAAPQDPATIADGKYDRKAHRASWIALREMIASVNRGLETIKQQSATNAANVGKRISGELAEIYKGRINSDVIDAVMADAAIAEHPKQYAAKVIERLIREGKTTIEAYQSDTKAHERAKNPALNYQHSDGIYEAVKDLGKNFFMDFDGQ